MRYITKLLFNLCIIGLEIALIWTGYNAFTQQWKPIYGTIIFIGNLVVLWFCLSIIRQRKFKYQRPRLFKTTIVLIVIAIICAFTGIQPFSTYKSFAIAWVKSTNSVLVSEIKDASRNGNSLQMTKLGIDYEFAKEFKVVFNLWRRGTRYPELVFYPLFDADAAKIATALSLGEATPSGGGVFSLVQQETAYINETTTPSELVDLWTGGGLISNMRFQDSFRGAGFAKVDGVAVLLLVR